MNTLSALLLLANAHASSDFYASPSSKELYAPIQLSFELGNLPIPDESYDLFNNDTTVLPTRGLRVGYAFNPYLSAIAGWHHGARGQQVYAGEDETAGTFNAAFYGDLFLLGAKASLPALSWAQPYATVQGAGLHNKVRLDDDSSDPENLNQIERGAFVPGFTAGGGLDILMPFDYGEWALTTNLELAYSHFLPAEFDDLGDVQTRGFTVRWGVGARF